MKKQHCFLNAGVTAWHAVVTEGKVRAGDTVVVQGTGGVSLFALQFAKIHGARVIVTSSSDEKLEKAMKLGAEKCYGVRIAPEYKLIVITTATARLTDRHCDRYDDSAKYALRHSKYN